MGECGVQFCFHLMPSKHRQHHQFLQNISQDSLKSVLVLTLFLVQLKTLWTLDREILVKNVLVQFRELFWDKKDIFYLENGAVDSEALFNKIENYPKENFDLKTSLV